MTGAELLLLLSIAVAFTGFGWYGRVILRNREAWILAEEAERLAAKCAELATTRADLTAECVELADQAEELERLLDALEAKGAVQLADTKAERDRLLGIIDAELPTSSQGGSS